MTSRVQVVDDENIGTIVVVSRTQKARVDYECSECGHTIEKGTVYRYEWQFLVDDRESHVVQRRHEPWCYEDDDDPALEGLEG
jgi:hypothetical protein